MRIEIQRFIASIKAKYRDDKKKCAHFPIITTLHVHSYNIATRVHRSALHGRAASLVSARRFTKGFAEEIERNRSFPIALPLTDAALAKKRRGEKKNTRRAAAHPDVGKKRSGRGSAPISPATVCTGCKHPREQSTVALSFDHSASPLTRALLRDSGLRLSIAY